MRSLIDADLPRSAADVVRRHGHVIDLTPLTCLSISAPHSLSTSQRFKPICLARRAWLYFGNSIKLASARTHILTRCRWPYQGHLQRGSYGATQARVFGLGTYTHTEIW